MKQSAHTDDAPAQREAPLSAAELASGEEPLTSTAAAEISRKKTVRILIRLIAAACILLIAAVVAMLVYASRQTAGSSSGNGSQAELTADSAAEDTVYYYSDVPATSYCYNAVQWASRKGIAYGSEDGSFSPDESCTRAQAVTFLWRLAGKPEPSGISIGFTDLPDSDDPCLTAILWAVSKGIAYGTTASTFEPDAPVTRAQAVTFLWRMAGEPVPFASVSTFEDVSDPDSPSYRAILWALDNNLVSGITDTTFEPDTACSRAQLITILYRYAGQS